MHHHRFFLTVIFVATLLAAHAQSISIGAKGGLSLTKLTSEPAGSSTSDDFWPRYHLGVFGAFRFTKFSIQPEVLYSRQGGRRSNPSLEARFNLEYISIPVLFKWHLPSGFNVHAGPQLSILASGRLEVESGGSVASTDVTDSFHEFDWALCLGAGWETPFGLIIDARYNLPITNVSKASGVEMHNQVIQLSAGYRIFKFGK